VENFRLGGRDGIKDPRFVIEHAGDPEFKLITRSSDSQLMFLVNKLAKMKHNTPLGSRIAEVHRPGKTEADPLRGRYALSIDGKSCVVEYEPDPELRDTEQVLLLEEGGSEAFVRREVLPHVPDAWIDADTTKIGYEISFTRYFYRAQPLRTLEEIRADLEALQKESEGLLEHILLEG
jgi:hypothetical protein